MLVGIDDVRYEYFVCCIDDVGFVWNVDFICSFDGDDLFVFDDDSFVFDDFEIVGVGYC